MAEFSERMVMFERFMLPEAAIQRVDQAIRRIGVQDRLVDVTAEVRRSVVDFVRRDEPIGRYRADAPNLFGLKDWSSVTFPAAMPTTVIAGLIVGAGATASRGGVIVRRLNDNTRGNRRPMRVQTRHQGRL